MRGTRLTTTLLVAVLAGAASAGEPVVRPHVTARLLSETTRVRAGEEATVGLHLQLDPGWHVYWRNPGESGLPPSITWDLPAGFAAGPIRWPAPRRIQMGPVLNFGYEDEVLFPVSIRVPADASGRVTLRAKATWLVCEDVCIDGEADLALDLSVSASRGPPRMEWSTARARMILPTEGSFPAFVDGDRIRVRLGHSAVERPEVDFFPDEGGAVTLAAPAPVAGDRGRVAAILLDRADEAVERLRGVLVVRRGSVLRSHAYEIDLPIAPSAPVPPQVPTPAAPAPSKPFSLTAVVAVLLGLALAVAVLWRSLDGTR